MTKQGYSWVLYREWRRCSRLNAEQFHSSSPVALGSHFLLFPTQVCTPLSYLHSQTHQSYTHCMPFKPLKWNSVTYKVTTTMTHIFCFLDRAFSITKTKINQQNAQINSGLIYYWSITPTCFGPSVEAIIRKFEILESYKAIVLIC